MIITIMIFSFLYDNCYYVYFLSINHFILRIACQSYIIMNAKLFYK